MIEGRKQLRLFGLDCLECMYPNPIGSQGKTIQSQVNLDHPDLNKYPKFKETHCYYCILHPGNIYLYSRYSKFGKLDKVFVWNFTVYLIYTVHTKSYARSL